MARSQLRRLKSRIFSTGVFGSLESGNLRNTAVTLAALAYCLSFNTILATTLVADGPTQNFTYTHLWASQDGETHFAQCQAKGFTFTPYSLAPQWVKDDFGGVPTKMVLTELIVGTAAGPHSPPSVQLVTTIAGAWYVITSNGTKMVLRKGSMLFQDNTVDSPAKKVPQHSSGTQGSKPCHQFVVQFNRTPEVDNPCPL